MLRVAALLCAIVSLSNSAFAANQPTVTPYNAIRTRLALVPGQTYLSFMRSQVKPGLDAYERVIQADPATASHDYRRLQLDLIAQGAGVAIRIDARNYIFNIGYLNGSDPENDVKSGRSYGVGPFGTESDPSDLAYLRELENYLHSEPGSVGLFVEALMKVLTDCDPSGWSKLSPAGQSVATDFLAIYTAESDRHLMVGLRPNAHPWEIDLAAATFVSVFDAASGLIMKNGAFVRGSIEGWWAQGTQGSGIGETRRDRIALQTIIARAESQADEVVEISRMTGNAEVIQGLLEYLNSARAPLSMSGAESARVTELMSSYLLKTQKDWRQIAGIR